jgi:hypothetical protein
VANVCLGHWQELLQISPGASSSPGGSWHWEGGGGGARASCQRLSDAIMERGPGRGAGRGAVLPRVGAVVVVGSGRGAVRNPGARASWPLRPSDWSRG